MLSVAGRSALFWRSGASCDPDGGLTGGVARFTGLGQRRQQAGYQVAAARESFAGSCAGFSRA
jgi:hypothetical protein